jgi:hypothetical protein
VGAGPGLVPRLQRSAILVIRLPALPGWADFGYRPSGPRIQRDFCCVISFSTRPRYAVANVGHPSLS